MKIGIIQITIFLLLVFSEHSFAETKSRGFGIGFKYAWSDDQTSFEGTAQGDSNVYIEDKSPDSDDHEGINSNGNIQFPIFLQLEENLINNFVFSQNFLFFGRVIQYNQPPIVLVHRR